MCAEYIVHKSSIYRLYRYLHRLYTQTLWLTSYTFTTCSSCISIKPTHLTFLKVSTSTRGINLHPTSPKIPPFLGDLFRDGLGNIRCCWCHAFLTTWRFVCFEGWCHKWNLLKFVQVAYEKSESTKGLKNVLTPNIQKTSEWNHVFFVDKLCL